MLLHVGMKCAVLLSESTRVKMASQEFLVSGKPVIKSSDTCDHRLLGICNDCNLPAGLAESVLDALHLTQDSTYNLPYCSMPGQ